MQEINEKKFKVNKIVFYNKETKWGVLAVEPVDDLGSLTVELMNEFSNISLSGGFEGVYEGAEIVVTGDVVQNPKYGKQIAIRFLSVKADTKNREGVVNFLAKSWIAGISVQNANKIYDKYKDKAIEVTLDNPDKLIEISGIGVKTIEKIKESAVYYKSIEPLIKYCTSIGLTYSLTMKLNDIFGDDALRIVKENPFQILEYTNAIPFRQVDEIFLKDGGSPASPIRLKVGLLYMLRKLVTLEGSTGCSSMTLKKKYYELLEIPADSEHYEITISQLKRDNKIVTESRGNSDIVYYKEYLDIEKNIAFSLRTIENEGTNEIMISSDLVEEEIKNFPFELNKQQVEAVHECLRHHVAVLTAPAGAGKSTITKALYRIYGRSEYNVELLSPTAKACRRLEECTGGIAQTIHKFLGMRADGFVNPDKYPRNTVLIIDEASMLDIILFNHLLNKATLSTRILLVGDNNQLPSVQAGNVLGDVISSSIVHTSLLTDIMRQQENSNIIKYCSMINKGEIMDPCDHEDFHYEEFGSAKELRDKFFEKYLEEVETYGLNEVQVIAPYKRGELGMDNLNLMLQKIYQDRIKGPLLMEPYRKGDRVRHTQNNYKKDVYNGETGVVAGCEDEELAVDYGNKVVAYTNKDIDELTLSYASTVHASQGSEYKVVFVILDDTSVNDFLHIRRLLYTAVSRGKKRVYIYTKPYLVDKCISNDSYRPRITRLKEYLRGEGIE